MVELDSDSTYQNNQNKTSKILKGMASNILKHVFLFIRTILDAIIDFVFSLVWEGSRQELPPLTKRHSVLALSAVELAAKIRRQELTSAELVAICIERIKTVNPILNAVTDERYEDALQDAANVDLLIANRTSEDIFKDKPFLGVPFTVKESHAARGMLHTLGARARTGLRAADDAECVRLLRESGAVLVAVTNVPEANKWQESRNMIFGQTNNPYHSGRTAGGSSGGEAALAAALAVPISLCSDIGGSTRMPAFYCGLFGFNPTGEHTSMKGSALRSGLDPTMASVGFVSKHCCDLAPLIKVVASDKAPLLNVDEPVDLKKIKYYYVETAQDLRVSPICKDLRDAMKKVINHLTKEVASTELAPQSYYHAGLDHMYSLWRYAMTKEADVFARVITNNTREANGVVELGKKLLGQSDHSLAAVLKLIDDQVLPRVNTAWAETLITQMRDDLLGKLSDGAVLVFPSAPAPAPYHYSAFLRPYNFAYWAILNVMQLPAVQVPLGLNAAGLPLGVQVVAGPRQDRLCLAVAQNLSDTFGGFVPPCRLELHIKARTIYL